METSVEDPAGEILVVDDTLSDRQFLTDILTSQGYSVRSASSGAEALAQVETAKPDLILLDVDMPGMDGLALCREIKQRSSLSTVPIIFISSFDDTGNKVAAFNSGGVDYVTKPFKVAEIKARIRTHLQMKRSHDRLGFEALHDVLTGLPNRKLLTDRLHHALSCAGRYGTQVAVVYIDLDDFKQINDRHGHDAGDQLLTEVARRLLDSVRESDTVARMGGDEFALILHDHLNEEMTLMVLQRILRRLEEPVWFGQAALKTRGSIGFSMYPDDGGSAESLLKSADIAMYHAKQTGGNNFQRYTLALRDQVNERLNLDKSLRSAAGAGELELFCQPCVDAKNGGVACLEVSVRWRHPMLGLLLPQQFLPVAEETGLTREIGEWTMRAVCLMVREWAGNGMAAVPVTVSISGAQLVAKGFAEMVEGVLRETGVAASSIELNVMRLWPMHDSSSAIHVLGRLKACGVAISVDDFGAGCMQLGFLKRISVDKVRMEIQLVHDIDRDPRDLAVCRALIALAHGMNMKVTVTGVETEAQLAALRSSECDQVQGFHIGPPLAAADCAALLQGAGA